MSNLMSEFVKEYLADTNGSSTNDANDDRICLVDKDDFIIIDDDSLMFNKDGNVCDSNGVIVAVADNELIAIECHVSSMPHPIAKLNNTPTVTNAVIVNRARAAVNDQTVLATPCMPTSMDSEKQQTAVAHWSRTEKSEAFVFECEF